MTEVRARRSLVGPLVGSLVFVAVVPGTVVGWVPYRLTGWTLAPPLLGWTATRWAGAALFLAALPGFAAFIARFVVEGRGTPAPVAPTERLVVGGLFGRVRNPGYVCVVGMVVGQGLWFGAARVVLYGAALAVVFHLFVILYEEPTLRRQFGAEYEAYCARVPRWLPRLGGGAPARGVAGPRDGG